MTEVVSLIHDFVVHTRQLTEIARLYNLNPGLSFLVGKLSNKSYSTRNMSPWHVIFAYIKGHWCMGGYYLIICERAMKQR